MALCEAYLGIGDPVVSVRFGVLGPIEVHIDDELVPIPAAKHRILLAALLLRANQVVSAEELKGRLWEEDSAPAGASGTLRTYVMRLRQTLNTATGTELIVTGTDGYSIQVPPDSIDLDRFRSLVHKADQAKAEANLELESCVLSEALSLWRGEPLVDVPSTSLTDYVVPQLVELFLNTVERRIEIELRLGKHADLIVELRKLVNDYPLREQFWAQLMLALYRANRQAEALETYRQVAKILSDELGIDPGSALRDLHQAILTGDAELTPPPAVSGQQGSAWVVPSQLPADIGDFVGRADVVDRVAKLLTPQGSSSGIPVVTLSGPPGIGKTAFAVHVAYQVRDQFPDGQLYVNLMGFALSPMLSAEEALTRFLRALGVSPTQIPLSVEEQAATFRSLLAGRRVLIVLDNAATPEQVRPLLPGAPGCGVLVTSRDELRGLAALNGAQRVSLDVLTDGEATELLSQILGPETIHEQPHAAAELVGLCARLPLALRIAAANVALQSTIADYVAELRQGNRLAAFAVSGDEMAAVRAAFDLSYAALPADAQRVFRLLGIAPCLDFTAQVAAALAGISVSEATRLLRVLGAANLIQWHATGRHQFHDLLRLYAATQSDEQDGLAERDAALGRLFDFYLFTARNAADTLYPSKLILLCPPKRSTAELPVYTDFSESEATAWFDSERANLIATIDYAAANGPRWLVWQLAYAMWGYLHSHRHMTDWLNTTRAGLDAAKTEGDQAAEAAMVHSLGITYWAVGDYTRSSECFNRAITIQRHRGFLIGEAVSSQNLGAVAVETGQLDVAAGHFSRALAVYRKTHNEANACDSLLNLGLVYFEQGRLDDAIRTSVEGMLSCRKIGYRYGEVASLGNLGRAQRARGDIEDALRNLTECLEIAREMNSTDDIVDIQRSIAELYRDTGRYQEALDLSDEVLVIARETENPRFEVDARNISGQIYLFLGRYEEAGTASLESLALARQLGYQIGTAAALFAVSEAYARSGRAQEAQQYGQEALEVSRAGGFGLHEGQAHTGLGRIYLLSGDQQRALEHANQALTIHRRTGYRMGEARTLNLLGLLAWHDGDADAARGYWQSALDILEQIGNPQSAELRELLANGPKEMLS